MKTVVIGSGSWGSALAQVLADNNQDVMIYSINKQQVDDINQLNQNPTILPNVMLNPRIQATLDIEVVKDADIIILSIPSFAIVDTVKKLNSLVTKKVIIVNTAKGFHPETSNRLSVEIRNHMDKTKLSSVVSLIGPSHAEEVGIRLLTLINAVSLNIEDAKIIQSLFSNDYFRVYTSTDELGCELGVALKNIYALCSGIASGLGFGDNTRAALMTRGLSEMRRYVLNEGGKMETLLGLCGVGDLIVTCTSIHSRNFKAGEEIGKRNEAQSFLAENTKTVEGINACKFLYPLAKKKGVELPIVEKIYDVLFNQLKPSDAVKQLMMRNLKNEFGDYND